MNRLRISFILILFLSSLIYSQKKEFTIEDVVLNSYTTLAPSTLKQLTWLPGEYSYSYVEEIDDSFILVKGSATSGRKIEIISLEKLSDEINNFQVTAPKKFPKVTWINDSSFRFNIENNIFVYDFQNVKFNLIAKLGDDAEDITIDPNEKQIAFTIRNNLYVSSENNSINQVTFDGKYGLTNGKSVSRNEFGITGGIFWSPKSNYIAFYREDLTNVTDYPLVKMGTTPASLENIKYPMAGQKSQSVGIGIYNISDGKTVWLKTGGPDDQYLASVTWGPEEKFIYAAHLNRDQDHLRLIQYNAVTGEQVKILFEEKNEKYVEPEHPLYFLPKDKNKFIWFSERDGWNHLYLFDIDGKLLKQITKGEWIVTKFHGFDYKGENIFITATKESPLERHLYKVEINSLLENITKLTDSKGTHKISLHSSGLYIIDKFSSTSVPGEISILNNNGESIGLIHIAENPIKDFGVSEIKISILKADDGTDLYCRTIIPPDFDPSKKYPAIVYVYGGPHLQIITDSWSTGRYNYWFYKMAQKGYIVFTLDNRGSDNRGLKFEQATFRQLGTVEVKDQLVGVDYLKSLEYIDQERIGVYGWSYGGFMVTSLMTRTDQFKVGVGGGAVIDWKYYEIMYTERYMDTPESNPEGYEKASLLNYVENLNGKLLLVHGIIDPVVVWQNTLEYAARATMLNIPLDYYPYPGYEHHIKGKDKVGLYTKITNYFLDNL